MRGSGGGVARCGPVSSITRRIGWRVSAMDHSGWGDSGKVGLASITLVNPYLRSQTTAEFGLGSTWVKLGVARDERFRLLIRWSRVRVVFTNRGRIEFGACTSPRQTGAAVQWLPNQFEWGASALSPGSRTPSSESKNTVFSASKFK